MKSVDTILDTLNDTITKLQKHQLFLIEDSTQDKLDRLFGIQEAERIVNKLSKLIHKILNAR